MTVIVLSKCPASLRGVLTRWFIEISAGVFVGKVSARVRAKIWNRITEAIGNGTASMVFQKHNEQGYDFWTINAKKRPVDFDGLVLMKEYTEESEKPEQDEYVVLDLETTGFDAEKDQILEIGLLLIKGEAISQKLNWIMKIDSTIPKTIQELTGLTDSVVQSQGIPFSDIAERLSELLDGKKVIMHYAPFDLSFLKVAYEKIGLPSPKITVIDTRILAKEKLPNLNDYKLATLANHFLIPVQKRHRAMDDCLITWQSYDKLKNLEGSRE